MFANDPDTGNPISDNQYDRLNCYLAYSFQRWMWGFDKSRPLFVALIPKPPKSHPANYYQWDEWVGMTKKQRVAGVAQTEVSSDNALYSPLFFRVKITPHGSRASHLTDLLKHASAEVVSRTTGQTPGAASYYNRGENSLIQRMAGAFNHKDANKIAIRDVTNSDGADFAAELSNAMKSGLLPDFIVKYGLTKLYVDQGADKKIRENTGVGPDLPSTIMACSTHLCPHGFSCPDRIVGLLGGVGRCSMCPEAIFATHFIFAVSAKRHQLAEELCGLQSKIRNHRSTNKIDPGEALILEKRLDQLAKDLMGWYLIERSLDVMITKERGLTESTAYLTTRPDSARVGTDIPCQIVTSDPTSQFLMRIEQVYDFPEFLSNEFTDKMNRCARLILAEKGELYNAVMAPSITNPQNYLMGAIRQLIDANSIDVDRLISIVNMTQDEWGNYLLSTRKPLSHVEGIDGFIKG